MIMLCFHCENSPVLPKYPCIDMGDYAALVRHVMSYENDAQRKNGEEIIYLQHVEI